MKKISRFAIVLGLLLSNKSFAQNIEPRTTFVRGVLVSPIMPVENESISFTLYGEHAMTASFISFLNYSIDGNTIHIEVESKGYVPSGQAFTPFDTTFRIEGLPAGAYEIDISGANYVSQISDSSQLHFSVRSVASIEELTSSKDLSVYPNPSTGELNLLCQQQLRSYSILDRSGRLLLEGDLTQLAGVCMLNLSELNKGYYILCVHTLNDCLVKQIILE